MLKIHPVRRLILYKHYHTASIHAMLNCEHFAASHYYCADIEISESNMDDRFILLGHITMNGLAVVHYHGGNIVLTDWQEIIGRHTGLFCVCTLCVWYYTKAVNLDTDGRLCCGWLYSPYPESLCTISCVLTVHAYTFKTNVQLKSFPNS